MDINTILGWMQAIPFFSPFNREELMTFAQDQKHFFKYEEGNWIIQEGKTDSSFYILLKGSVRVSKETPTRDVVVNKFKEGSVFGELSILRRGKRTSSVIAEETCVTMAIKPKHMDEWDVKLQNKFRDQLLKVVLKRFETIDNKHAALLAKHPEEKE